MMKEAILQKRGKRTAPATFMMLPEEESEKFDAFLDAIPHVTYEFSPCVLAGTLGVRKDVLERAAQIAHTFYKTCHAVGAQCIAPLRMQPFKMLPHTQKGIQTSAPFFQFFRMDFYIDPSPVAESRGSPLRIIEVNSGGAGLTNYRTCADYLSRFHNFDPPEGFGSLHYGTMMQALTDFLLKQKPEAKTLGFVAVENCCSDYISEYLTYADWLQAHTNIKPVLLELNEGRLSLFHHDALPSPIKSLSELDAVMNDWFEDLTCLERVEKFLQENDILTVPPRSDLLFENKSFLPRIPTMERPDSIPEADWHLLQQAILPSFPLSTYKEHLEEIRSWNGFAVKMDIDCGGENVFIFDYHQTSRTEAEEFLQKKLAESTNTGTTWTVQAFQKPPMLPVEAGFTQPDWLDDDYATFKYDLMTFMGILDGKPHVLFGSRQFTKEKINDASVDGRWDESLCAVCGL